MSNIKEVIINPNKPADVKFVQYDTGQKLYVKNSPDFDFTNTTEIQITDGTESAARYRFEPYEDGGIVALPDTMFRNAGILKGYIFSVDPHGHTTEALISIGIRERPVYNEYISDADEEVVIPAGFEVIQNPESVTIKAYNTDGTVTEGTVENGTTVVANPSGPAVEPLNKLQVGNSIYNIPSGGSLSDYRVTWVENSTDVYPKRYVKTEDVGQGTQGTSSIELEYQFVDDTPTTINVKFTVALSYEVESAGSAVDDRVWLTEEMGYESGGYYDIMHHITVTGVTCDTSGVSNYDFSEIEYDSTSYLEDGDFILSPPNSLTFTYNGNEVEAWYQGEDVTIGTYTSTITEHQYCLGLMGYDD
jgi:hypothetical protein